MRPDSITLAIFEKYSSTELAETAQQMARAQSDMESAETEKKVSDGVFNERIKTHAAEVSELAQKYNKGGETAQIGCTIRYDVPTVGQKSYIRMDSEETVEVHDMSVEEKQETFQFPLSTAPASDEAKPTEEPEVPKAPKAAPKSEQAATPAVAAITFKDIQCIAGHIANLQNGNRKAAIVEMQKSIAEKLLARGQVIAPDGRLETVETREVANTLATAWLQLAIDEADKPKPPEGLTRICPYPGCILFAEHEGNHEFPKSAEPANDSVTPQPQMEKQAKRRKRRPLEPPPDEPASDSPPGAPR